MQAEVEGPVAPGRGLAPGGAPGHDRPSPRQPRGRGSVGQIERGEHDLIVMGSRGRGRVTSNLFGGVEPAHVHFHSRVAMCSCCNRAARTTSAWPLPRLEDQQRDLSLGAPLVAGVAAVGADDAGPQAPAFLGRRDTRVDRTAFRADLDRRVGMGAQVVEPTPGCAGGRPWRRRARRRRRRARRPAGSFGACRSSPPRGRAGASPAGPARDGRRGRASRGSSARARPCRRGSLPEELADHGPRLVETAAAP